MLGLPALGRLAFARLLGQGLLDLREAHVQAGPAAFEARRLSEGALQLGAQLQSSVGLGEPLSEQSWGAMPSGTESVRFSLSEALRLLGRRAGVLGAIYDTPPYVLDALGLPLRT